MVAPMSKSMLFTAYSQAYVTSYIFTGCRAGLWQCADGSCIPERMKCDGRPQCEDSSDEVGCGE